MPIKREFFLFLLPRSHLTGTDEDGDGAAGSQHVLKRALPRLAGHEVPAIKERIQAALAKGARHSLNRLAVAPVVAHEDVVSSRNRRRP